MHRITSFVIFLAFLSLTATAAPARVALIKVKSGSASLDGQAIKKVQIANQGQILNLGEGAEVRIQLLGSSSEVVLNGPARVKIDKDSLLSGAKKVTRGGVGVASDIGSLNTAGASITRSAASPPPEDALTRIHPVLPPVKVDTDYLIRFQGGEEFTMDPDTRVKVELFPAEGDSADSLETDFSSEDPLVPLQVPTSAIVTGVPYYLRILTQYGEFTYAHTRTFRILTAEQEALLAAAREELIADHGEEEGVVPLLRLASLYQDYDQYPEVIKYLRMAYDSPYLTDVELKEKIKANLDEFQNAVDVAIPVQKVK